MNGRRAVVGLCMLCALLVSAFAAQSASATAGTTAFTCKSGGDNDYLGTDTHCKTNVGKDKGTLGHVAIPQDKTTEIELTSANTNATTDKCETSIFKTTIGGVAAELKSCDIHGVGWMENKVDGLEHYSVSHFTLTFTAVTASLPGCKVWTDTDPSTMGEEGVVHTEPLRATTKGQGHSVKIEPTTGTTIARFYLTSCNTAAFNGTYTVSGTLNCVPSGATNVCSHSEVTTQNTLKLNGATKSGQNGPLTVKARENSGQAFTAISSTTVNT